MIEYNKYDVLVGKQKIMIQVHQSLTYDYNILLRECYCSISLLHIPIFI